MMVDFSEEVELEKAFEWFSRTVLPHYQIALMGR